MSDQNDMRAIRRLQALRRYVVAAENGDLDGIAHVLTEAETDPGLERLLSEFHTVESETRPVAAHTDLSGSANLHEEPLSPVSPSRGRATPRRISRIGILLRSVAAVVALGAVVSGFVALKQAQPTAHSTPTVSAGGPPSAAEGIVVAGTSDGQIVAVRPSDGAQYWRYTTGTDNPIATMLIKDQVVYAVSDQTDVFAIRAADGRLLWSAHLHQFTGLPESMYLTAGVLLVATGDGIHAFRASDGTPLWSSRRSPLLAADNGVVFVGNIQLGPTFPGSNVSNVSADNIEALRASDGSVLWTFYTGDASYGTVVGSTFYLEILGGIQALRVSDGHPLWSKATTSMLSAADSNFVYVTYVRTCALSLSDGATVWCSTSSTSAGTFLALDGEVYVESVPGSRDQVLTRTGDSPGRSYWFQIWLWNSPALQRLDPVNKSINVFPLAGASGQLYLPTSQGVYAIRASDGRNLWHAFSNESVYSVAAGW